MPEHVHEWAYFNSDIPFLCRRTDCLQQLGLEEAERRINATERLSERIAQKAAAVALREGYILESQDLAAYASALERE